MMIGGNRTMTIVYTGKHTITYTVPKHSHATWEFIYYLSGSGKMSFEQGATIAFQAGTVIVVPPNFVHSSSSKEGFTNIHLNIQDAALYYRTPISFQDDRNHFVQNAFQAAFHHFKERTAENESLLKAYCYLLVSYAGNYCKERFHNPIVEEIKSNIIHNYADCNYELDKYLSSRPFSIDYLRKIFKSEIGMTPHQYLSDLRLQTAAEWLISFGKNANMTEVSRLCGFREPLYFSRMFKKKYGVSPKFYISVQQSAGKELVTEETVKVFPQTEDV